MFDVPKSPSKSVFQVDKFLGVDYTNQQGNVDITRSPNGKNMIRDVPGKVRKCMGYECISTHASQINGYHKRRGDTYGLVHSGTKITKNGTELYSAANDALSTSWQIDDKLYIIDGKNFLVYSGATIVPVTSVAKIPTLTISKTPSGGGQDYEPLNLLQPKFTEHFSGTTDDTVYYLTFSGLDDIPADVKKMQSDGTFITMTEGTDYTVDLSGGFVTFTTAPGVSPQTGEDNIYITVSRTVSGYADRINKCDIGTLYGVNGAPDRIFLSGNPDYINQDWYSQQNDPTYFPDINYSRLGSQGSAIIGYSIINNYLATAKDKYESDRNVIIRLGQLSDGKATFPETNTLQGPGAIAKRTFGYLATEPLFLTESGVYAVTTSDISGEKYAQNRSFYIDGRLLDEPDLQDAVAIVYKDQYFLVVNGTGYIIDGLQPITTDKSKPYSTRQYVCFHRTNLPARCMWIDDGRLFFGTADGKIMRFFDDVDSPLSYYDDGEPIHCIWETPDLSGQLFYKNKTFRYLSVKLSAAAATSIKISGRRRGLWYLLKTDNTTARFFKYSSITYSKFTYSNDTTTKTLNTKIRIKKVDKTSFKFENDVGGEPFGLMSYACEFVENGNYKG